MEVDSADDCVGASEIEIPDFGSNIAGRGGFDDGLCMIDSIGDIGNMKAGAASRKRGGRKIKMASGGGIGSFPGGPPADLSSIGKLLLNSQIFTDCLDLSNLPAGRANQERRKTSSKKKILPLSDRGIFNDEDSDGDFELDGFSPSNKNSNKDTSQGFIQLLNVGSIDGSFEGSFLYFSKITINQH